jgi:NitT/TauT family transport system substrate-binding protein
MMKKILVLTFVLVMLLTAGCGGKAVAGSTDALNAANLVTVKLPLGYIPNVQFAPLYVAIEKGFYAEAGITIDLDYSMENDNAVLLANDTVQFAILSGEQVLLARDKEMPLVYVMAWYQQYPVGIASKQSANITSVADLRGRKIGLPGLYGASYIGTIALLDSAGLTEADVTLDSIGYNQVEVLTADREDAVVIYVANEPVQLEAQGESINLLKVSDAIDLVANGLVTNEKTLAENPELVKAMVAATLKGIQYAMDNPDEAFEISKKYVENLDSADQTIQKQVLLSSIELWKGDRVGYSNPDAWVNMQRILTRMSLISGTKDVTLSYNNGLLP